MDAVPGKRTLNCEGLSFDLHVPAVCLERLQAFRHHRFRRADRRRAGRRGGQLRVQRSAAPARELPIFYTHGTTDGLVSFTTATAMREAIVSTWGMQEKEVVAEGADYNWKRYANAKGTIFEFAQHDWETSFVLGSRPLAGHCFPGNGQLLGGGADTAFDWGQSVLDFFMRHPMP